MTFSPKGNWRLGSCQQTMSNMPQVSLNSRCVLRKWLCLHIYSYFRKLHRTALGSGFTGDFQRNHSLEHTKTPCCDFGVALCDQSRQKTNEPTRKFLAPVLEWWIRPNRSFLLDSQTEPGESKGVRVEVLPVLLTKRKFVASS